MWLPQLIAILAISGGFAVHSVEIPSIFDIVDGQVKHTRKKLAMLYDITEEAMMVQVSIFENYNF